APKPGKPGGEAAVSRDITGNGRHQAGWDGRSGRGGQAAQGSQGLAYPDTRAVPAAVGRREVHPHARVGGPARRARAGPGRHPGPGPAGASTRVSAPWRTGWRRPPPVARPLGGYSPYGVSFTVAAPVPGSAPVLPATVTTTGSPAPELSEPGPVATAPNQVTE